RRHVAQGGGERLAGTGEEVLPERPAASDLILPQPRLRLVDAQRGGCAPWRAEVLGDQPLLVDAVAGFVQDPEERLVQMVRVEARRDAAIAGADAAAERVRRNVEPAGVEVEADGLGGRLAERLLLLDGVLALKDVAARLAAGCDERRDQRRQLVAQVLEKASD